MVNYLHSCQYCLLLFFFLSLLTCQINFAQSIRNKTAFYKHKHIGGYALKKLRYPEIFQGNKEKRNYFEGWYFKMVSADKSSILSVIPGISLSHDGKEQHAFIQVIDGKSAETLYFTFPIEDFSFSTEEFAIRIGKNYFSTDEIVLKLHNDSSNISGTVKMSNHAKFPTKGCLNSGIMGWYRFVPFMECYHGVLSLNHQLQGVIKKNDHELDFNNGRGYIEKDWGSSMPSAWIWMQSNHFTDDRNSFMLSIADVPWMGKSFTGFLGFFLHDSILYRFATYTHAKLSIEHVGVNTTQVTIKDRKHIYTIEASRYQSGVLKAPVKGSMDRRISESIDARILLTVSDRKGVVFFKDSSTISGLELVGDQNILLRSIIKKK